MAIFVCLFFLLNLTPFILMDKFFFKILFSVLFIALFAQISISVPVGESDIPITGQTFAVLLVAYIFKRRIGTIAVLFYVLLGVMGLPIFADGKSGIATLIGGSGGFLFGFVFSAYVVGYLGEKDWTISFAKSLLAMILGTIIILFFGVGRLAFIYGFEKALEYGFYPFWQGAIFKIILGAAILPLYHRWKK